MQNFQFVHVSDTFSSLQSYLWSPAGLCSWISSFTVCFHCYADDTQLYLHINPDESKVLGRLHAGVENIKTWMTLNFILLNCEFKLRMSEKEN